MGARSDEEPIVTVIPDLTKHSKYRNKEFVLKSPYGRFYAGAPVRTPQGFNIGAYCILDDKPRDGLTELQTNMMQEMAVAVMTHLDRIRATAEQQRAGKMIRGLGNFLSGRPGLEDWWCKTNRDQDDRRSSKFVKASDRRNSDMISKQYSRNASYLSIFETATPAAVPVDSKTTDAKTPSCSEQSSQPYKGVLTTEVLSTFRRAADLIRDAVNVDGVLFLDASISSFGGLVGSQPRHGSSSELVNITHTHTPKTPRDVETPRKNVPGLGYFDEVRTPGDSADANCEVLALATSKDHNEPIQLGQRFLSSLLERYPRGRIWCFEDSEDKEPLESPNFFSDESTAESFLEQGVCRTGMRSRERHTLRKLFPGVRSLAFTGLWDSHRNRWFASSMIWACDPVRVFALENELSYLSAFGDTIMAEVSRVNVKNADRAKADFISSISHELRSPLHGILGSVECLQETDMEASQADLLGTVKTCGETLLDTVHHLLDHAKIQTLVKDGKASFQSASFSNGVAALETNVDLSLLAEQAVETVFAGHTFVSSNTSIIDHEKNLANGSEESHLQVSHPIDVCLSFRNTPGSPWIFRTSAGAWRRIILNLVGNSLKYTAEWYVKIELDVVPNSPNKDELSSRVTLTVSDTGMGISEDFLQNKLFEPFAQEDFLMPGTGLGMSMCRQIVASLGGKIEVQSKKDKGTIVRVTADLVSSMESDTTSATSDVVAAARMEEFRNMRFNFFGFASSSRKDPKRELVKLLGRTSKDWFDMDFSLSNNPSSADVHMTTQDCIADIAAMSTSVHGGQGKHFTPLQAPVIVLCNTTSAAHALKRKGTYNRFSDRGIVYISQPCGPRKLAKALDVCLPERSGQATKHLQRPKYTVVTTMPLSKGNLDMKTSKHPSTESEMTPSTTQQVISPPEMEIGVEQPLSRPEPVIAGESQNTPSRRHSNSKTTGQALAYPATDPRVLIVDDNMVNLKILETYMKKRGLPYATAVNGLQALELYKKESTSTVPQQDGQYLTLAPNKKPSPQPSSFSWILMDINMPVMDGFESTRRIRAFERDSGLAAATVIALTGLASASAQQEAYGSGVDIFLTKPVRLMELTRSFENLIGASWAPSNTRTCFVCGLFEFSRYQIFCLSSTSSILSWARIVEVQSCFSPHLESVVGKAGALQAYPASTFLLRSCQGRQLHSGQLSFPRNVEKLLAPMLLPLLNWSISLSLFGCCSLAYFASSAFCGRSRRDRLVLCFFLLRLREVACDQDKWQMGLGGDSSLACFVCFLAKRPAVVHSSR